jgi:hypothetical protein
VLGTCGSDGHDGGRGEDGGPGRPGGDGGHSGGGAGGSIKFEGTVIATEMAVVDVQGGGGMSPGGPGRIILATNAAGGYVVETYGASYELFEGPRVANPYIAQATNTPPIPNLPDGAEAFGLLSETRASSPEFDAVVGDGRNWASAAIVRQDTGPSGSNIDFIGHDYVLMLNLCEEDAPNPLLGISLYDSASSYLKPLMTGGYKNDPRAGGGQGPITIDTLPVDSVYATLLPEGRSYFNAAIGGTQIFNLELANGEAGFIAVDDDGDGVANCHDECPGSDPRNTIVIEECDSGVTNYVLDGGCKVSDFVQQCEENATNHGQFAKCVSHLSNRLARGDLFAKSDKGRLQQCAARSNKGRNTASE